MTNQRICPRRTLQVGWLFIGGAILVSVTSSMIGLRTSVLTFAWILSGFAVVIGVVLLRRRRTVEVRVIAVNLVLLILLCSMLEVFLAALLTWPNLIPPGPLRRMTRSLYRMRQNTIQYDPTCARYDSDLSYVLRPGVFEFANQEFSNEFRVNSAGLRDDEDSLHHPEIVVLGDSHAMGWGVNQEKCFPHLIEHIVGRRVLNVSTSSYGTARELEKLSQLDTSAIKAIVVQYCRNDFAENRVYGENNKLPIMSRSEYSRWVDLVAQSQGYWFGKNLYMLASRVISRLQKPLGGNSAKANVAKSETVDEAGSFLNVLRSSAISLSHIPILVIELNEYCDNNSQFLDSLRASLARDKEVTSYLEIHPLDVSKLLDDSHYYQLDEHMNDTGHKVVADAITRELRLVCPELFNSDSVGTVKLDRQNTAYHESND